jgi:hypothetical protein
MGSATSHEVRARHRRKKARMGRAFVPICRQIVDSVMGMTENGQVSYFRPMCLAGLKDGQPRKWCDMNDFMSFGAPCNPMRFAWQHQ